MVGPVATLAEAERLVDAAELDDAILDINLNGDLALPDRRRAARCGTRIVFTTGYDENVIPPCYAGIPRCPKPITRMALQRMLESVEA